MGREKTYDVSKRDLKAMMARTGLNRSEIARELDITIHTIQKWVSNERIPVLRYEDLENLILEREGSTSPDFIADEILPDRPKFTSPDIKQRKELIAHFSIEELVEELENRCWTVTLNRKASK